MSFLTREQKKIEIRKALRNMPHATEEDVEFVLEQEEKSLANGDSSFFKEEDFPEYASQNTLNSSSGNVSDYSMNNVQQSSIDPNTLNAAGISV